MFDLVLKNAQLPFKGNPTNIGIKDGKIHSISSSNLMGNEEMDLEGNVLLPPFVEMHTHLDTVLTAGEPRFNQSGTLGEAIDIWSVRKQSLTKEDVKNRAFKALKMLMEYGVLYVRAAVDISDSDLTALHAIMELREELKSFLSLQIIAFPQNGIISCPENQERLEKAILLGADAVSAVPHLESTREEGIQSLEFAFSLAKKYEKEIHIFCDEVDDEHSRFLEVVARLTMQGKMEGKVTASHANAMLYYSDTYANKVMSLVKKAQVTIVCCPLVNTTMQGRADAHPKGRGITRLKELAEQGVNVCIAHDDIQTPFYPFGNGNILQAAHMALHLAHMTGREELKHIVNMITINGARAYSIKDKYGIEVGKEANFVCFSVKDVYEIFFKQPKCRYLFRKGALVVETVPERTSWK
ncbi:amidohydrolase family protein [Niallia circulans]|uniref:amidohydrolase family protein n=1 Tax=Niallia circulans TaxID=1397 RepID=UPI00156058E7|nr:amidohydrolase family protein [Niallia circulans]NRG32139.1 amidohydrolase family protein [Niallia circulans]